MKKGSFTIECEIQRNPSQKRKVEILIDFQNKKCKLNINENFKNEKRKCDIEENFANKKCKLNALENVGKLKRKFTIEENCSSKIIKIDMQDISPAEGKRQEILEELMQKLYDEHQRINVNIAEELNNFFRGKPIRTLNLNKIIHGSTIFLHLLTIGKMDGTLIQQTM